MHVSPTTWIVCFTSVSSPILCIISVLLAQVTGLPIPNIEWLINGRPVIQDSLHKILVRENNVHSLLLERASPMDEGQYTIVATNKAGKAVHHVQLHVTRMQFNVFAVWKHLRSFVFSAKKR